MPLRSVSATNVSGQSSVGIFYVYDVYVAINDDVCGFVSFVFCFFACRQKTDKRRSRLLLQQAVAVYAYASILEGGGGYDKTKIGAGMDDGRLADSFRVSGLVHSTVLLLCTYLQLAGIKVVKVFRVFGLEGGGKGGKQRRGGGG